MVSRYSAIHFLLFLLLGSMVISCTSESPAPVTLHVTALGGDWGNATIWLETIPNGRFDSEEPGGLADENGNISITVFPQQQKSLSSLEIHAVTQWSDKEDPDRPGSVLMTRSLQSVDTRCDPISVVLSPFITIATKMARKNPALAFDPAIRVLAHELHLAKSDIQGNYNLTLPKKSARKIDAIAVRIARLALKTDPNPTPHPVKETITAFRKVAAADLSGRVACKEIVVEKKDSPLLLRRLGCETSATDHSVHKAFCPKPDDTVALGATKMAGKGAGRQPEGGRNSTEPHTETLEKLARGVMVQWKTIAEPGR